MNWVFLSWGCWGGGLLVNTGGCLVGTINLIDSLSWWVLDACMDS